MSFLDPVWQQRGLDALRDMLDVDVRGKQQMIDFLFEEGLWDAKKLGNRGAMMRFNACLNPAKQDFWKPSELWALMKRFRRYQLLEAMAEDLGFELRPIPTEERRQALLLRIAEAMEHANTIAEGAHAELARLEAEPPGRAPHPSIHTPGPHFMFADTDAETGEARDAGAQPGGF